MGEQRRGMRRAEREITDPALLHNILQEATILFLAFNDSPAPYVVPVCFAHDEQGILYVHSAREGAKIELLGKDPHVGFSASTELTVVSGEAACDFTSRARSVAGTGHARIVESDAERTHGLDLIMRHYARGPAAESPVYRGRSLARTAVIAIDIISLRGKQTG
jgi:nitroimidazol reductase NimA-like FMN-containing flavoprotein (pyridoxamine 5'-phosphate oxidase superfamily)